MRRRRRLIPDRAATLAARVRLVRSWIRDIEDELASSLPVKDGLPGRASTIAWKLLQLGDRLDRIAA